ncbi:MULTISPECIES: hypothetical protein [Pseudomonadota]|uniref:hypothetical protein n=1 Tax=Pseudomonadota TaxID=1224 RepID=UPI00261CF1E8|nr:MULTISPECIES: hypothetical protein [Pseudomonadota]
MSHTDDELIQAWKDDLISKLVFTEIQASLEAREQELIGQETKRLVEKNQILGGSEHGFYYKSELFVVAGAYGKEGIEIIDPSLEEEAEFLRLNRVEVQQHTTYIAHFLGALERFAEGNPSRYCANAPRGLMQLSDSLSRLDLFCQKNDAAFYEDSKFHPEDKAKAPFFAHYNRVDDPINRFLFRRTAY